jgi:hypothetical protein
MYRRSFWSFLTLITTLFISTLSTAQDNPEDYATIYIYKPKASLTGIMRHTVKINGKEIGWLRNGSKMRYKMYTTGPVRIDLNSYIYLLGTSQRDIGTDIRSLIEVEPGKSYYMRVQFNLDGSGQGYHFVNEEMGRYEYNRRMLFKNSARRRH